MRQIHECDSFLSHGKDIRLFVAVSQLMQLGPRLNVACCTVETLVFLDASVLMMAKLKISSLSAFYDLNHLLYAQNGEQKGVCDACLGP